MSTRKVSPASGSVLAQRTGDYTSVPLRVNSPFNRDIKDYHFRRPGYHPSYRYPNFYPYYRGFYPYYTSLYPYYSSYYPITTDYHSSCYTPNPDGSNQFVGCYKNCGSTKEEARYTNFNSCCTNSFNKDSPRLRYGYGGNCPDYRNPY